MEVAPMEVTPRGDPNGGDPTGMTPMEVTPRGDPTGMTPTERPHTQRWGSVPTCVLRALTPWALTVPISPMSPYPPYPPTSPTSPTSPRAPPHPPMPPHIPPCPPGVPRTAELLVAVRHHLSSAVQPHPSAAALLGGDQPVWGRRGDNGGTTGGQWGRGDMGTGMGTGMGT